MIILDYILGSLYAVVFILALFIFHPLQVLAYNLFGWKAHQKVVVALNFVLGHGLKIAGTTINCAFKAPLPTDRPIIFISNHQSKFDVVCLCWYLRKHYPLYVAKIELAKGIPSISYNLRKSGAALIQRKDKKQSLAEIMRLGRKAEAEKRAVIIFPEGTRSRDGRLKSFAIGGIAAFVKTMPSSVVVPIAVQGTGNTENQSSLRVNAFKKIRVTIAEPIEHKNLDVQEVSELCHKRIANIIEQN